MQAELAQRNLEAMRAVLVAGDTVEPVDDHVNVANGRGPGRLKFRSWRRR